MESKQSYLYYVKIFIENKKSIFIFTAIAFILSIIYAFFMTKPIFLSKSTVKSSTSTGGLGALLSQGLPDLGEIGDLAGGLGSSSTTKQLALYETILLSRRSVEETIIKFNLKEKYKYVLMDDMVNFFRNELLYVEKDRMAGTMEIGIFDEDPVKAKDMTQFLIEQLNKINTELNIQDATNNREFIQGRYDIVREDLKKAEVKMEEFQNVYGVAPDVVIKAVAQNGIALEAEIKSEEIKLELLRKMISSNQPEILAQENKIKVLKQQLNEINNSSFGESKLSLKGSPEVAMEYARHLRDLEIQNKLLAFIIPLLEQAKIEENNRTPSVLILDYPNVPDKKAKPKRIYIVIGFTAFMFFIMYLFYFSKTKFKSLNIKYKELSKN